MKKVLTEVEIIVQGAGECAAEYRDALNKMIKTVCSNYDLVDGVKVSVLSSSDGRMTTVLTWNRAFDFSKLNGREKYEGITLETLVDDTNLSQRTKNNLKRYFGRDYPATTIKAVSDHVDKFPRKNGFGVKGVEEVTELVNSIVTNN